MKLFLEGNKKLLVDATEIALIDDQTFIIDDKYKVELSIISDVSTYDIIQTLCDRDYVHLDNVHIEKMKG